MLHIILFLLKIIGIIIASLLGIFLLLIGLILFVPVRYRAEGEKGEKQRFYFMGSWLFHILHISFRYEGGNPVIKLRIIGIPIFDSTKEKKEKKLKRKKSKDEEGELDKNILETEELVHILEVDTPKDMEEEQEEMPCQAIEEETKQEGLVHTLEITQKENVEAEEKEQEKQAEEKEGFFSKYKNKLKEILLTGKKLYLKILELISNIQVTIKRIINSFKVIYKKIDTIKEFLSQDENKQGFSTVFGALVQILKKIGPAKIKGRLRFGTGDPCSTGQLLGVISTIYGMNLLRLGDNVTIEPDFENPVIEGELFIKGRFRFISLLIIGFKMITDKKFKTLKKNVYKLKEEL